MTESRGRDRVGYDFGRTPMGHEQVVARSGWLPVTEFADGWKRMDDEDSLYPPPRAAQKDGEIHVQVNVVRIDGRDPVEGERVFRVPPALRTGRRLSRTSWVISGGMYRVEEQVIDADGWQLVPRVLLERPSTAEDMAMLDEAARTAVEETAAEDTVRVGGFVYGETVAAAVCGGVEKARAVYSEAFVELQAILAYLVERGPVGVPWGELSAAERAGWVEDAERVWRRG